MDNQNQKLIPPFMPLSHWCMVAVWQHSWDVIWSKHTASIPRLFLFILPDFETCVMLAKKLEEYVILANHVRPA
jgi:hypothetical protein